MGNDQHDGLRLYKPKSISRKKLDKLVSYRLSHSFKNAYTVLYLPENKYINFQLRAIN